MREIKFRYVFQHIETGNITSFIAEIQDIERHNGLASFLFYNMTGFSFGSFVDFRLLERDRFTGLKDKNGTEIYEGDVMGVNESEGMRPVLGAVVYEKGRFVVKDGIICYGLASINEYTRVIGNIHENPELLKS